jgi:hypothetical protein
MPDAASPVKIAYRTPTLRVYGDAKKLTETSANGANSDGGGRPGANKTA